MKRLNLLISVALLLILSMTAFAQKAKSTAKKPISQPAAVSALELREGADKVSIQIKNVTKFLYMLGGIAYGIEDLDTQANTQTLPRTTLDANMANKAKVMQAIRNLRAGIATLEVEFRTKPSLKKFLPQIDGITRISAECEDLAAADRFSDSGQPLLILVEKLSDALAAM
ncbi:MAG: hypothetical protein KBD94_00565 [Pyrinomonadaceae bacterium]|nr:hypothetical protein [Pyrinomonadaceae bacterium]